MKLISYIRLVKFRYHISFFLVVLGTLLASNKSFFNFILPLLVLYLSFNVLMYSGLYTLNDIADIESDSKHPKKKNRPLPSKIISVFSAYVFSFFSILIGLLIAYFYFGLNIFFIYLLFILVNQFYTHIAKKIAYVEILFNSLTYPMRFFLGFFLVTNKVPMFFTLAILFLAIGFACIRRITEKKIPGWEARKVLRHYTGQKLVYIQIISLLFIIFLFIVDYPAYFYWYVFMILMYVIFLFGGCFTRFYNWLFLN